MPAQVFKVQEGFGVESISDTASSNWLNGTFDPSVSGQEAPISSIFTRNISDSNAEMYQKVGPLDTDWAKIASESQAGVIGPAETTDYTDGLFTDFTALTPIGTFADRVNEILKALAPQPAPILDVISNAQSGALAKLSFGVSNVISGYSNVDTTAGNSAIDINGTYAVSGTRRGSFISASKTGNLNDDVVAKGQNYPAKSFGPGDQGELRLEVNGSIVHTVDLSAFGSGSSDTNGSGFVLSAATSVKFEDGTNLDLFKYRTGTWVVASASQRDGFNYVKVNHYYNSADHYTGYHEWVNDSNSDALSAQDGVVTNLNLTGIKTLSGVTYNTGGTADYSVTINNAYKNVYSSSASAITFTGSNCSASSQAIPSCTTENDAIVITNKLVTISNASRLLNANATISVNCLHPLKSALSNAQSQTISGLLIDNINTANSDTLENFCLENYRLPSVALAGANGYALQSDVSSGSWTSSNSIISGDGYADGLLVYNDLLVYPTQGLDSGDFRNISDGNANGPANGPSSNPNYSSASGVRYFYRKFRNNSGATKSNLKINITGTSSFASVSSGPSGQALTVEMKFSEGSISTATGWMDCYADFSTGAWIDGAGCRSATNGAGRATSTDWGITVGTKSIASNEFIVIRVAAPSTWTGNLSAITLTWL